MSMSAPQIVDLYHRYRATGAYFHAWRFSQQIFELWLSRFATLRLVNWDMISHKSTDTISRKIFDYSFLEKCLYLSLFPSTVSMSAVLRRRRAKKYLLYSRLRIPQRLTFRA
jgi:hypothetical protein